MTRREEIVNAVGCVMILSLIRDGIDDGTNEPGGKEEDISFIAQNEFGMDQETVTKYLADLVALNKCTRVNSRYIATEAETCH